jgi:WD40 repeat protein
VPPLPPIPLPQTEVPPPAGLSSPAAPLLPAPPPPELAEMVVPSWLKLEAVHGTSHDIHHRGMKDTAFARDGRSLVTLGHDGALRVWDLVTRGLAAQSDACAVKPPPDPFRSNARAVAARKLALSRDGLAAVGFDGGRICVLELAGNHLVRDIDAHDAHVVALAFTPDGALFSYGYQELQVMEASIGPIVRQREAGGQARWWNARTGARLGELVLGWQEAVALSSDGQWLATGRARWDMRVGRAGKAIGLWRRDGGPADTVSVAAEHVAVTQDRDVLYAYGDEGLRLWTGTFVHRFETVNGGADPKRTRALAISDDGRFASTLADDGGTLIVWNVRARREIGRRTLANRRGPDTRALRLTFSADGSMIATSGGADVVVWATRGLAPLITVERGALVGTLQPDGRHVLAQPRDAASLVDITTGKALWRWPVRESAGVALLPDGRRFLESYYDKTKLRDVATGRTLWELGHQGSGPARRWLVSPDGARIAFNDHMIGGPRMHDAADGRLVWHGKPSNMLAFSADGRTLYVETRNWHVLALATSDGAVQADLDRERTSTDSLYPTRDGKRAIIANHQQTAGYDLTTRKRLWESRGGEYAFCFRAGDQSFVSHEHNLLRLRSMVTGADVGPPFDVRALGTGVQPLLLPDGETLLVGTGEGLVLRFRIAG